jgi:hypothetical protein
MKAGIRLGVTPYCLGKNDLIPLHPPLSKVGILSPPFGKACLPVGRDVLGGILQHNFKQLNCYDSPNVLKLDFLQ